MVSRTDSLFQEVNIENRFENANVNSTYRICGKVRTLQTIQCVGQERTVIQPNTLLIKNLVQLVPLRPGQMGERKPFDSSRRCSCYRSRRSITQTFQISRSIVNQTSRRPRERMRPCNTRWSHGSILQRLN